MVQQHTKTLGAIALIAALGCGRGLDKVETIKGPKGDTGTPGTPGAPGTNGQPGAKGDRGEDGKTVPAPAPVPTVYPSPIVNLPPTMPYPPVIVVYPPYPQCPSQQCPEGYIIICACIENSWKTVSVDMHDTFKYSIKNYGPCY
jgi:hypothetical protein